jgi:hypothetical protein
MISSISTSALLTTVPPVSVAHGRSLLVDLLRLGVVADEDDVDLLVVPRQEQVQQDEEALGQVLARLVHRARHVHQAEHHRLAGGHRHRTRLR